MATININANDTINININVIADEPKVSKKDLFYKLREELIAYTNENNKRFWYEVWIDLSENWDGIYEQIKNLDHQAAFDTCLGFLERMEDYYSSPKHYDDLNDMLKNIKDWKKSPKTFCSFKLKY